MAIFWSKIMSKKGVFLSKSSIPNPNQISFISPNLMDNLNPKNPLVLLGEKINWGFLESELAVYYSSKGREAKPIRLMVGLLILKSMKNLSDKTLIEDWEQNIYMQAFCGMVEFQWIAPCHSSDLTYFRQRIGKKGCELILQSSIELFKKEVEEEKEVLMDTTAQEKNITYPTDSKLALKIIRVCHKIAKKEKVQKRRSYLKEIKDLRIKLRHFRHAKKRKTATKALRRLKTIACVLLRELKRKLPQEKYEIYKKEFQLFAQVLGQKKKGRKKIYSLHEPSVYCMAKGKDNVQYEYGCKVGVAVGRESGVVMGIRSFAFNRHDSRTVAPLLAQIRRMVGKLPEMVVCDRGYKGKKEVSGVAVKIPSAKSEDSKNDQIRFRKRAGIEAYISHLKHSYRMLLSRLKGRKGDFINACLAGAAFNFSKWIARLVVRLFFVFSCFLPKNSIFWPIKTKKTYRIMQKNTENLVLNPI